MSEITGGMRALLTHKQRFKHLSWLVVAVTSLALTAGYLSAWMSMPIYPDETAIRLLSFRAIADHGLRYSIIPYCTGSFSTSLTMMPFAYALATLDSFAGWSFVRVIPLVSLLALVASAMLAMQRRAAVILFPFAFVGVAGAGLILMRPECFLVLQSAALLVGYRLTKSKPSSALDASWMVGSLFLSLLSIQIHPQGMLLLPVWFIITARIVVRSPSKSVRALGCVAAVWTVAASLAQFSAFTFLRLCPARPLIEGLMKDLTIFGPTGWPKFSSSLTPWMEKFQTYANNFSFQETYFANYLPGLSHDHVLSLTWLNRSIALVVLLNFLVAVAVIVCASYKSARLLLLPRKRLASIFGSGSTLLALGGAAVMFPFLVDHYDFFYRSHLTHLALVLINAVALSTLQSRWHTFLSPAVYCVAIALCLQSTITTARHIEPKFSDGWQGPSLSVKTDWNAVSETVSQVAMACGIGKSQERIFVDDLTYTALKAHPHLLSMSYTWAVHATVQPGTSPMAPIRQLGTALLVRCYENFGGSIPAGVLRYGDLCCANYEQK